MNSRDQVFQNVRNALAQIPDNERAPYPEWDDSLIRSNSTRGDQPLWERFAKQCRSLNGTPLDGLAQLAAFLKDQGLDFGYCDPALLPLLKAEPAFGEVRFETTFDRKRVDDYKFGITRASGAIAESGTIMLKDRDTASRLGALAPWVHITLLKEDKLLPDIGSAIQTFGDDPNIIWASGPSKTADVEGIMIEGVHGPGVQVCCRIPRS